MSKLRLLAVDTPDLEVIASAVQDSIFQIGQTRFDSKGRSFTLRLSRYMHDSKIPRVATEKGEAFAVILGLDFVVEDSPAGHVFLRLAGGGTIRLAVEALDITLADHGEPRPTKRIPKHDG